MDQCILKCSILPDRTCPWMTKSFLQTMRRECIGNYTKLEYAHNKFVGQLCNAKEKLFANVNPRDQKMFLKTVKYLNNYVDSIPTLSQNDALAASDKSKANQLNSFSMCFNTSHPPLCSDNEKH